MFFNKSVERTWLDHVTGTFCVFVFPFLIYFCIFSIMVCKYTSLLSVEQAGTNCGSTLIQGLIPHN